MDAVKTDTPAERHVRAFRATDAFAIEAFQAAHAMGRGEGEGLAREIRRTAARSGGALVAASVATGAGAQGHDRGALEAARAGLLELRYYLYLARRLGLIDVKKYRQLALRQDAALREIDALIGPRERSPP